jgi:hypothetical protein
MKFSLSALLSLVTALSACTPIETSLRWDDYDVEPPRISSLSMVDERTLVAEFNEPVELLDDSVVMVPDVPLVEAAGEGSRLIVRLGSEIQPGEALTFEAAVADGRRNITWFAGEVIGLNQNPPTILINEFTTQGSGSNPDMVELLVLRPGSLAGLVLLEGVPGNYDAVFHFPAIEVETGDFILVHMRPEGITEEVDELNAIDQSGGLNASDLARDFWLPGGEGLSGNNGVISVGRTIDGPILDGVLYSNRTSDSDEDYRGFGSRTVLERAEALTHAGEWTAMGGHIAPEDAVNPEPSTGTRSVNRRVSRAAEASAVLSEIDGNSRSDWHIVPTRGASFGAENSEEVYAAE